MEMNILFVSRYHNLSYSFLLMILFQEPNCDSSFTVANMEVYSFESTAFPTSQRPLQRNVQSVFFLFISEWIFSPAVIFLFLIPRKKCLPALIVVYINQNLWLSTETLLKRLIHFWGVWMKRCLISLLRVFYFSVVSLRLMQVIADIRGAGML